MSLSDALREVDTVRDERLLLVERLRAVEADGWDRPTLCAGWTVRHVLAHLVTPFRVSGPAMVVAVARHRGIGRAMDEAARRIAADAEPAELLAVLEEHAASTFRPPGLPLAAPLTDIVAHSADVRWGLGDGLGDWGEPARLRPVLGFLTGSRARAGFVPSARLRGVALVADDQDWRHGHGAVVAGSSLALALAALGRAEAHTALRGDGLALLVDR